MNLSFIYNTPAGIIVLIVFIMMMISNWLGFRVKLYYNSIPGLSLDESPSAEGALLGLLALLLAFTFSMSSSRYELRKQIIVEEANDIGTAVLRADLYPDSIRNLFRADFKKYVDSRIAYYDVGFDEKKIQTALANSNEISSRIWKRAAALGQDPRNLALTNQMIPAVNAMIDIVTTRDAARNAHVPDVILFVLFLLLITGSFIVGYGRKGKRTDWINILVFALMTALTVYLILDLDRPRRGIITLDTSEDKMVELRSMFNVN